MSLTKELKIGYVLATILLILNVAMVVAIPNKPPKIVDASIPTSPINAQIKITFSENMNTDSVSDGGFIISPRVAGDFSWSGDTMFFTPSESLEFAKNYEIEINTTVQSLDGENLKEVYKYEMKMSNKELLYLSNDGRIGTYGMNGGSEYITPENFIVTNFDYDSFGKRIVILGRDEDAQIDSVYIYNFDDESLEKIKKLSDYKFQVNHAKWVPFENKILVSRTKIQYFNRDGSIASLFQEPEETELSLYDVDTSKISQLETGNALYYEFYPSPDGLKVAFITDEGAFVLKDLKSDKETLIASEFYDYFGFSKYGGYAIYLTKDTLNVYNLRNNIVLQAGDGSKKFVTVDDVDALVGYPTISPDEELVAFSYKGATGNYKIGEASINDGEIEYLTNDNLALSNLAFSPDGKEIAFLEKNFQDEDTVKWYDLQKGEVIETTLNAKKIQWRY